MFGTFLERNLLWAKTKFLGRVHDLQQWRQSADEIRDELRHLLDMPDPGPPPKVQSRGVRQFPGYSLERLWIQGRDGIWASAALYRPAHKGKVPAVLHLLGHYGAGAAMEPARRLDSCLAESGVAVLAVDNLSLGSRRLGGRHHLEDHHFMGFWHVLAGTTPSRIIYGETVRFLDWLASRPWVDPARIGATGSSGGGTASLYLAATDSRISALSVIAAVSSWEHFSTFVGGDPEQFPKGLVTVADFPTLLALVAPRPTLVAAGRRDDLFPAAQAARSVRTARRIFALFGRPEGLRFAADGQSHGLKRPRIQATVRFFLETFGLKDPGPTPCSPTPMPSQSALHIPRPPRFPSFLDVARRALRGPHPRLTRARIRTLLGLPDHEVPNTAPDLSVARAEGLPPSCKALLIHVDRDRTLPATYCEPGGTPKAMVVYAADGGHTASVLTPVFLEHHVSVLSVDLSGLGELWPTKRVQYGLRRNFRHVPQSYYLEDFFAEAYLLVTKDSLPALRTRELLMVAQAARRLRPGLPLALVGQGPLCATYALLAAASDPDVSAVLLADRLESLKRDMNQDLFPLPGVTLPGLLTLGDMSDLVSLVGAARPVATCSLVRSNGTVVSGPTLGRRSWAACAEDWLSEWSSTKR